MYDANSVTPFFKYRFPGIVIVYQDHGLWKWLSNWTFFLLFHLGKARRLKQAKEEAQDEIEKYRKERERQFREFEAKHMGSREDVASKIEVDTKRRIEDMNRAILSQKEPVSFL